MATHLARDYGSIGASSISAALSNLTGDLKTMSDAKSGLKSGDSIHLAYDPAGANYVAVGIRTPWFWNGGTIAIDPGISLVCCTGGGGAIMSTAYKNCHLTIGSGTNPAGWTGPKAGRFAVIIDPAQTNATAHTQFMAWGATAHWLVEYYYILGNWDTSGTQNCPTANCMSTAGFIYPGTAATPPDDITLHCGFYDHGPFGYGQTQVQSGTRLRFISLDGNGGKTLRIEQDNGAGTNHIDGLVADGIKNTGGSRGGAVAIQPHNTPGITASTLWNATITNVSADSCANGLHLSGGSWANAIKSVSIDGVAIRGGSNAQLVTCGPPQCPNTCFKRGASVSPVDGSAPAGMTVGHVSVSGTFSGGNQGYDSTGFSTQFDKNIACSGVPLTGHVETAIGAEAPAGTTITEPAGELVTDD